MKILGTILSAVESAPKTVLLAVDVAPGETVGGWTAVTGLPEDDDLEVVTDGAYELKLALAADAAKPAGHFHADGTFHEGEDEYGN